MLRRPRRPQVRVPSSDEAFEWLLLLLAAVVLLVIIVITEVLLFGPPIQTGAGSL